MTATPVLHMPDEPIVRADGWLSVVLDGGDLELTGMVASGDGHVVLRHTQRGADGPASIPGRAP